MTRITENTIEQFSIDLLQRLGYNYVYAPTVAPDGETPERESYSDVLLLDRLQAAIRRINPKIKPSSRDEAIKEVQRINSPELLANNESFHRLLTEGIKITYNDNGDERGDLVWLIDFKNPKKNDFVVANQFTVIENDNNKRPDIILFVNGIPLVVIELKNAANENATVKSAFKQIETYKATIPGLFTYNAFNIISDGLEAKAGSLSAGFTRFMSWKSSDGKIEASHLISQLETLINGMLNKETLLDLIRHFTVFEKSTCLRAPHRQKKEDAKTGITTITTVKKLAAYHQYYAVNRAVESTIRATGINSPTLESKTEVINSPPMEGWSKTGVVNTVKRVSKNYFNLPYNPKLKERARNLRKAGNLSEVLFWNQVKKGQFKGFDFDRQKIIGNYIVDFYCSNCQVVIEIDGSSHDAKEEYDAKRDIYLKSLGLTVIHIPVEDVLKRMNALMEMLYNHPALASTPPEGNLAEGYGLSGVESQPVGDRKGGVIWHTQGSGKSLSMVFYTGKIVLALDNPTVVVITDRNDLDDQLFDTFASSTQLLRQEPKQIENRDDLKEKLKVASGGVIFTTIQKFQPETGNVYETLSERENIVVIADEAHRTQYGLKAKDKDVKDEHGNTIGKKTVYGFAKYMRDALPNATYLGFTGTPIENTDVNTPAVFGNYVDVYDIAQAVEDGATVRIFYESRLAKVNLSEEGKQLVEDLDENLREDDLTETQKAKAKWTQLEALIGSDRRLKTIAKDIVTHFEQRQEVFEGKAMIVTMSRRIAADLYKEIVKIKPEWHSDDLDKGSIKVVMTSNSSDGPEIEKHHTTKQQRKDLADRMKDTDDELKLVIVRDMWLTGFDAPSMHTLYIDKPMKGHNLMQAIARVNRVYKDKPGGLVVDYLGIASDLKKALSFYSDAGGKGDPTIAQEQAVQLMLEKLEVISNMYHLPAPLPEKYCVYAIECSNGAYYIGQTENLKRRWHQHLKGIASDYTKRYKPKQIIHFEEVQDRGEALSKEKEWKTGYGRKRLKRLVENGENRQAGSFAYEEYFQADTSKKLSLILAAEEHILSLDDGKKRYINEITALSKAFAIAIPHEQAMDVKEEVSFFQAVKARLAKFDGTGSGKTDEEIETTIRQVIDQALVSEQVIDVFDAAGIKKPDISILSEEFLLELKGMEHKNVALEVLKKLLNDEIKSRAKTNLVQSKSLMEMLENSIKKYHNKILTAAEVIDELIKLSKEIVNLDSEAKNLGLTEFEYAFYSAVSNNESAKDLMEKDKLRELAIILTERVKQNASIDWTIKESVRAKLKVIIKRTLRQFGYPPDMQKLATETVLKQAEMIANEITVN
ncbi:MAG: HsdR family type I site-specific deoxyribonuclease [Bacteroidales bacterium]|nr:HsdR family type I site-specific deoxyribonuclease [Bacteroidales bacterium]